MEERTPEPNKCLQQEKETELKKNVPTVTNNEIERELLSNKNWSEDLEFWNERKTQRQRRSEKGNNNIKPSERVKTALDAEAKEFIPREKVHQICIGELEPEKVMTVEIVFPGGHKIKAVIDTGADRVVMTNRLVKRIGMEVDSLNPLNVRGVGRGNIKRGVGKIKCQVEMFGRTMEPVDFHVIETSSLIHDVLLGREFLKKNGLKINKCKSRIQQVSADGAMWEAYVRDDGSLQKVNWTGVPCRAEKDVEYESGNMIRVPVSWGKRDGCSWINSVITDTTEEFFYDGEVGNIKKAEFMEGIPGILDPDKNEIFIEVEGRKEKGLIKKGDIIGRISSVVTIEGEETEEQVVNLKDAIKVGEIISESEKRRVMRMLENQKEVFSSGDSDIGRAALTAHKIELYDQTPIRQRPRRLPDPVAQAVEDQCQELEELGIIEPSKSPWSSPIVPIRKKDGTIRLCVDYRKLNQATVPDRFPMPNAGDILSGLGGMKYFTTLDLVRGYYQMPIEEESREFTAFSTPRNHWQFKRLPFGLKNAPSAFQREMQAVLRGFSWRRVLVYIDDILIMSESFEEHLEMVERVLSVLKEHGMKIKPGKCCWFREEVQFLGHMISSRGMKKTTEFMNKIKSYRRPENTRELREFLGLVNYQRKFIPGCSEIAKPLSGLTGGDRNKKLVWTEEMEESFESLKREAAKEIELTYPDYRENAEPMELSVDASGVGAGACLAQRQEGEYKIIEYASMTFSGAQKRYSTTERELAALRWGVKTFKSYLYGVPFVIYTDHRPLLYLQNMKLVDSRLARTLEDLSDFAFTIKFRPGVENTAADKLSRMPVIDGEREDEMDPRWLPDGLVVNEKVEGGGDSLFQSLSFILWEIKKMKRSAEELREELVSELLSDPKKYGLKVDKFMKKELKAMKFSGQLPKLEVILVFCQKYQMTIWMHMGSPTPIKFEMPGEDRARKVGHLQNLAGIHFNPVRAVKEFISGKFNPWRDLEIKEEESTREEQVVQEINWGDMWPPRNEEVNREQCQHQERAFSIDVRVDDATFCGSLDSGAEISLISKCVWEALSDGRREEALITWNSGTSIRGTGENKEKVLGVVGLPIRVGKMKEIIEMPFGIVEDGVIPYCVLLGDNFNKKARVEFDFREEVIRAGEENEIIQRYAEEEDETEISLIQCWVVETESSPEEESDEEQVEEVNEYYSVERKIPKGDFVKLQKRDYVLSRVRKAVIEGRKDGIKLPKWGSQFKRYFKAMEVEEDCLWYHDEGGWRPVAPFKVLVPVVLKVHQSMAHIGPKKLKGVVKREMWHPELEKVCRDVASTCSWCQKNKPQPQVHKPPIRRIESSVPFELVAMDLVELPKTTRGNVGALVAVDHFSKWLSVIPIRDKKAETVTRAIEERVLPSLPYKPMRVLTDNGPEFRAEVLEELFEEYGINHVFSTPYKPSSNGAVERVNRTVIQFLNALSDEENKWDRELTKMLLIYNGTYHEEIGMAPNERLVKENNRGVPSALVENKETRWWKEGRAGFVSFMRGQKVLKVIEKKGRLTKDKLRPKYDGPFKVSRVNPNGVTYEVEGDDGVILRAHHSQLREWREPPGYIKSIDEEEVDVELKIDKKKKNRDEDDGNKEESDNESSGPCETNRYIIHTRKDTSERKGTQRRQSERIKEQKILEEKKKAETENEKEKVSEEALSDINDCNDEKEKKNESIEKVREWIRTIVARKEQENRIKKVREWIRSIVERKEEEIKIKTVREWIKKIAECKEEERRSDNIVRRVRESEEEGTTVENERRDAEISNERNELSKIISSERIETSVEERGEIEKNTEEPTDGKIITQTDGIDWGITRIGGRVLEIIEEEGEELHSPENEVENETSRREKEPSIIEDKFSKENEPAKIIENIEAVTWRTVGVENKSSRGVTTAGGKLVDLTDWEMTLCNNSPEESIGKETYGELGEKISELGKSTSEGRERIKSNLGRRTSLSPCKRKLEEIRELMDRKRRESREKAISMKRWRNVEHNKEDRQEENQRVLDDVEEVPEEFVGFTEDEGGKEETRYKKKVLDKERDKCEMIEKDILKDTHEEEEESYKDPQEIVEKSPGRSIEETRESPEELRERYKRRGNRAFTRAMGKAIEVPWITREIPGRKKRKKKEN